MSNPELAIAKVNFSAVLFRKDPTPLTRPEIEAFHALLVDTIAQCSPSNVQKCRRWILDNLRPSPARIAGLAKYLVALSGSFGAEAVKARPSERRRQLHILYLLNDVLYDSTNRHRDDIFARELEGSLAPLFHNAANFQNCPKHIKKLEGLVELWGEQGYYPATVIDGLRDTIKEAPLGGKVFKAPTKGASAMTGQIQATRAGKDAPYVVPSMHGDPSTPWYDLPAGNWLPHLTPNSTKPMHPEDIKPLHLAPGPADKALAQAVKDLLKDVERIYNRGSRRDDDPDHIVDLNELGERVIIDEVTGDIIGGETYYGWSRGFCEKMRARKQTAKHGGPGPGRGRAPSRSPSVSSRSPSPPPAHKRRRLSRDASSSRSRSRSRRGRQYSRSRSRSPPRRYRSRSPSRTRTFNSRNRSPSPPRHGRPPFGSSSGNPSRTPSAPPPAPVPHHQHIHGSIPPFPPPPPMHGGLAQFTPPPPPPPPHGYQGGWVPPPPPTGQQQPGWFPPPPPHLANQGGWQPPPPPDFQQRQHQGQGQGQYQQYGRGGHNRGGRGRGGYDRGRGW